MITNITTDTCTTGFYAVSKLGWIRDQQAKMREQARETPREFVERESHYLRGKALPAIRQGGRGEAFRPAQSPQHFAHRASRQRRREARGGNA